MDKVITTQTGSIIWYEGVNWKVKNRRRHGVGSYIVTLVELIPPSKTHEISR